MTGLLSRRALLAGLLVLCALLGADRARACGQRHPSAPHGVLLQQPLASCEKERMLGPGRRPALYALRNLDGGFESAREPVVMVHGLGGHPAELAELAEQLIRAGYQVYVLFFDDLGRTTRDNGAGLALELADLEARQLGPGRDLTLIAHSAGGLVTRVALNLLADGGRLRRFQKVSFYAIDTPWHGYFGPSDRTWAGRLRMALARPLLPDGIEDLRAESVLFLGDPGSALVPLRAGLLHYPLPQNVHVYLYFAQQGGEVLDYTEGLLAQLGARLVDYYRASRPLPADQRLRNFWHALISADSYFGFQEELRGLADAGRLDAAAVRRALLRHFPRFPGDHQGVLRASRGARGPQLCTRLLQSLAAHRAEALALAERLAPTRQPVVAELRRRPVRAPARAHLVHAVGLKLGADEASARADRARGSADVKM